MSSLGFPRRQLCTQWSETAGCAHRIVERFFDCQMEHVGRHHDLDYPHPEKLRKVRFERMCRQQVCRGDLKQNVANKIQKN